MSMVFWRTQPNPSRWVVLDVETTGLDPQSDRLLSIAAVALHRQHNQWVLMSDDTFEVVLHQAHSQTSNKHNVLLHGIGHDAQAAGVWPSKAMSDFANWLADSPWMGYHAPFDLAFLQRQFGISKLRPPRNPWVDVRDLVEWMGVAKHNPTLDDCLSHAEIEVFQRHHAMADAWATAELWLYVWPRLREQGLLTWAQVSRAAAQSRWLQRQ